MSDDKVAEKSVYLGKKEEISILDQKFQVRGLTLGEGLEFSDVIAKLFVKGLGLSKGEEGLDVDKLNSLVADSKSDIARIEQMICKVTGKPEGFFQEQPPEFFAGILTKVIEMTNIKVVQENFTKMVGKLEVGKLIKSIIEKVPGATSPDLSVN